MVEPADESEFVIVENVRGGIAFDVPKSSCPIGYQELTKSLLLIETN